MNTDQGQEKGAHPLQEEIRVLSHLFHLVEKEKHSIVTRDYEGLVQISKEKESLAWKLKKFHEDRTRESECGPLKESRLHEFSQQRVFLLEQIKEKNLMNFKLARMHLEQVGTVLAFLRNISRASPVYDRRGRIGPG